MKDETYYLKKYLLLCDEIKNKSTELKQSFNDDMNISSIVRTTCSIFDNVVDQVKLKEVDL